MGPMKSPRKYAQLTTGVRFEYHQQLTEDYSQVQAHPETSLMEKHYVRDHHRHDTLIGGSSQTTDHSRANETGITGDQSLPDIRKKANKSADKDSRSASKHVAERNNNEVGISKCYGSCSKLWLKVSYNIQFSQAKSIITSMLTSGKLLLNSLMKICDSGAIDIGVRTLMKTKIAWLTTTIVFQVFDQFYSSTWLVENWTGV
jgi:hypothetical protein